MKIKVLVTGANGQMGKTLQHLFLQNDLGVQFDFYSKEELDITSKKALEKAFEHKHYNYCINCAAYTNVEAAEDQKEKAFLINATAVKYIAETCKTYKVKLIHISTDYVFDGNNKKPYKINDATNPINEYGKSKLKGEQNIQGILGKFYIIRASWLYSNFGKNFLKSIATKIKNNQKLVITTEQTGTPTSCEDLSRFILFIITKKAPFGIYNFSASGQATWFDFAKEISLYFKNYSQKQLSPISSFATKAKRPKYSVMDISKTENSYKELHSWKKSVGHVISQLKLER